VYRRKKKDIKGSVIFYMFFKRFDVYWSYLIATYLLILLASLLIYDSTGQSLWIIIGIFAPLGLLFLLNAYTYYCLNEFRVFQDIDKRNNLIRKANAKLDKMNAKVNDIRKNDVELSQ
jgi:hypothetical protein